VKLLKIDLGERSISIWKDGKAETVSCLVAIRLYNVEATNSIRVLLMKLS